MSIMRPEKFYQEKGDIDKKLIIKSKNTVNSLFFAHQNLLHFPGNGP